MSTGQQTQRPANRQPQAEQPAKSALDAAVESYESRRKNVVHQAASFLGVPGNKVFDLLRNIWRPSKGQDALTDKECMNGLVLIARYELDPFAKEVYVTRNTKGQLLTIVGIDGWIKILDRTEHYDGFDVKIEEDDKGNVVWVETTIYSKTRSHPATYRAYAKEYAKIAGVVAGSIPLHMLRVFGLRHAARLFVPLGGAIVTEEEAKWMERHEEAAEKSGNDRLATALGMKDRPEPQPAPVATEDHAAGDAQREVDAGTEPESKDEPPDDEGNVSDAAMALGEYVDLLGEADSLSAVNALESNSANDGRLTPETRKRVIEFCTQRRNQIRGKRGTKAGEQKSLVD